MKNSLPLSWIESRYFGCEYFLWQLYYWLHGGATYHWLWGRTIPVSDTAAWLEKIRSQAERICDDPVVFRWVEALYSRDVVSMGRISRARLHARTERWDLQNNIADDEAKYDLESWECYLSE